MNWLNRIKEKYSRRRIRQLDRSRKYMRDFVDIDIAKKIGLIINVNQLNSQENKLLRNYMSELKTRQKDLLLIEINYQKKSVPEFKKSVNSVFINPSKLNWLDYPILSVENQIKRHKLDILLNFDSSDRMTSKYICSIADAKTRTGIHVAGFESCYEVMVDLPKNNRLKTMITEYEYFLKMLEK